MGLRTTEARHAKADGLHLRPAVEIGALFIAAQTAAIGTLGAALPAIEAAAEAAADALRAGGSMGYGGAGSSGLMALADALELAGTFSIPSDRTPVLFAGGAAALLHMRGDVEDDTASAIADVARAGLGAGDVLIAVSASGTTPYALQIGQAAKDQGARLIGIANMPDTPLLQLADIAICLATPPEVVAGSTRLGAASAQKAALNLISVLVGIKLGHVHDGYMVNLHADNAKLRERALRIVAEIAGSDEATAQAALLQTQGQVKPAILVAQGMPPDAAAAALQANAGQLAPALKPISAKR